MELILWRHAEAADGIPDHSRALTEKGRQQAKHMAAFLNPRLPPNTRILVSPALRTQQTANALNKKFVTEQAIGTHANAQEVLNAAGWPLANGAILLVGHQPWLGEVAALLMAGTTDCWSIKKGAVWWFSRREREGDYQAVLRLVIAPEHL
ncbi:MAG: histidine phosphatase family protein [Gallionellaceae bacterium]|nr:MAG: histidine phosphatase family protein [Gallionellaceae bacterium]